ncbi:MAG: hypothetical protein ABS87_11135 [Sphingomonas sp. SCN 67-18]|uniref:GlsB/YeaQ/YmgE family stress response membrane protein n=1 Tax=uncultured Sphingomonas sp. TaxID=158754 RepID=UPI00086C4EE5|nr:GlsB/YeaQ/YmgE family stress response membrane protein [Sphingomonas sp. SCN 67-18]ODU20335.1 MAG: hypothetical protein ABS87_11135 [Sphingomonas sp. SCN 67-18]
MGNIFVWIFVGLLVGVAGKPLIPGRDPGGYVATILLGIAGALLGGFGGHAMGLLLGAHIASIVGAIVLLIVYREVMRSRTG